MKIRFIKSVSLYLRSGCHIVSGLHLLGHNHVCIRQCKAARASCIIMSKAKFLLWCVRRDALILADDDDISFINVVCKDP